MSAEILIVDDDPLVGDLSNDLLTEAGFTTRVIRDSNLALGALKEDRPRLVLLDILMPGIDGLTLLHTIKNDPDLASTRVAVVSGKSFSAEIERAKEYGAEMFIQKPYDVKAFSKKIIELIGPPKGGPKPAGAHAAGEPKSPAAVRLRVWGHAERDSAPCLTLEALDTLFVLDAGKGIVPLGERIVKEGVYRQAWLMLSHFHPDHVSGLGLFPCLRSDGFQLRVAGPREPDKGLADLLREAIQRSFAADPTPVTARIQLHELREDTYELLPGLRVSAYYANHPGTTLGFLFELAGRRIAYFPASEIYGDSATALQDYDEKIGRVCRGVDLFIHDARYREEDYATHKNEGHSSFSNTVEFAAENDVGRLILFHPDPSYSDADLDEIEAQSVKLLDEKGSPIPCKVARDGLEMEF
ncbi:MAG: response regulator [Elusimicrobiota bacterium]